MLEHLEETDMRKKLLHLVTISVLTTVMFAGCGNKEQASSQPTEDTTNESVTNEDTTDDSSTVEQTKEVETSKVTEEDTLTTDIDLEEAWLWINDSPELYETDGSVKWNEGLTRYILTDLTHADFEDAVNKTIETYKAHGYSYVGYESDLLTLSQDVLKERGQVYFKLELTDPVMMNELMDDMLQSYVNKGNTLPEGNEYEALVQDSKDFVLEYTTLGIMVSWYSNTQTYEIWVYGEFRYNGNGFVRFTENFEWIARWLVYNEEEKIWQLDPEY